MPGLTEKQKAAPLRGKHLEMIANGTARAMAQYVAEQLAERDAKIAGLEKRLADVDAGALRYCGVFQPAVSYTRGAAVTHGGSLWVATRDSRAERPGTGSAWQLAVKSGAK